MRKIPTTILALIVAASNFIAPSAVTAVSSQVSVTATVLEHLTVVIHDGVAEATSNSRHNTNTQNLLWRGKRYETISIIF